MISFLALTAAFGVSSQQQTSKALLVFDQFLSSANCFLLDLASQQHFVIDASNWASCKIAFPSWAWADVGASDVFFQTLLMLLWPDFVAFSLFSLLLVGFSFFALP